MDLLSQRYADPFLMLNEFIRLQQLHEFSIEIMTEIREKKIHDARWEYYLHKVWDNISFDEYVRLCENSASKKPAMTQKEIENVVSESFNMLQGFSIGD